MESFYVYTRIKISSQLAVSLDCIIYFYGSLSCQSSHLTEHFVFHVSAHVLKQTNKEEGGWVTQVCVLRQ